jgi:hypothetical protein
MEDWMQSFDHDMASEMDTAPVLEQVSPAMSSSSVHSRNTIDRIACLPAYFQPSTSPLTFFYCSCAPRRRCYPLFFWKRAGWWEWEMTLRLVEATSPPLLIVDLMEKMEEEEPTPRCILLILRWQRIPG